MGGNCVRAHFQPLAMPPHLQVFVLENVRFYKEEEKNDPAFAEKASSLMDRFWQHLVSEFHDWQADGGTRALQGEALCGLECPGVLDLEASLFKQVIAFVR